MRSILSAAASEDLTGIGDHIAKRNRPRAASFTEELLSACAALAEQPLAWPLIPRDERAGLRRRAYKGYLIIYRVVGDQVEIARVLHGARDYERLIRSAGR